MTNLDTAEVENPQDINKQKNLNSVEKIGNNHIISDASTSYACDICNEIFKSKRQKERHMTREHRPKIPRNCQIVFGDEVTYTCEKCKEKFNCKRLLDNHIKKMHSEKKKFRCKFCTTQTTKDYNYRRHLLRFHSHEKDPKVQELIKSCSLSEKKRTLRMANKMAAFPYPCDKCTKRFAMKRTRNHHIQQLHLL